jgi:hypothetical protein
MTLVAKDGTGIYANQASKLSYNISLVSADGSSKCSINRAESSPVCPSIDDILGRMKWESEDDKMRHREKILSMEVRYKTLNLEPRISGT